MAAFAQKHSGVTTDAAGTLHAPARDGSEAECPLLERAMALTRDLEVPGVQKPATLVEHARRQGALVGIDPDDISFEPAAVLAAH